MSKSVFRWLVEVPAALHAWIEFTFWLAVGGNLLYMALKGVEIHVLIPLAMLGVAVALWIGNQLPIFFQRLSNRDTFNKVALLLEELAATTATLTVAQAFTAWTEIEQIPQADQIRRLARFRKLKSWIDNKELAFEQLNGANANVNTVLNTRTVAAFFRKGCA